MMSKKKMAALRRKFPYEFQKYQYMFWFEDLLQILIKISYNIIIGEMYNSITIKESPEKMSIKNLALNIGVPSK